MPHRLDAGGALAALGGVVLLVSLFLDWYPAGTAWRIFELLDIALAALALAAVIAVLPLRAPGEPAAVGLVPNAWLPAIAVAALALVVVSLVNDPPAVRGAGPDAGAWIALAGALLIGAGAVLGRARISLVVSSRRPAPQPPGGPGAEVRPTEPLGRRPGTEPRPRRYR
jgi:hypothetical protein